MKIALVQLNYKIGDFSGNFAKIHQAILENNSQADLIVFSELCLCGYYPRDLVYHPGFLEDQNKILQKIQLLTTEIQSGIILGYITKNTGKGLPYHNSLCLIQNGHIEYIYHKRLLPFYNIFNEARHFSPGQQAGIHTFKDIPLGFLICEDGWAGLETYEALYTRDPVDELVDKSLQAIICINGSPANIGKQEERIHHFSYIAKRCQAPLIFTNQVGANDDIVFDGASFVLDKKGGLLGCLPSYQEAVGLITLHGTDIELQAGFHAYIPLHPVELFYRQIILGIKDYVNKCGFKSAVVAVSGGIDSALTLALAVKALGPEAVTAIAMPSHYSSASSIEDAKTLCENLNVKLILFSIEEQFTLALANFSQVFGQAPCSTAEQNMQARLRGRILMEFSNQTGALVLSTGNKSEISVGYTTLYGDMTGGLDPIGDLYKTDVYQVAHYFNQLHPATPIPASTIHKAPSAELARNQKDTDNLPPYEILDPILKLYIEGDLLNQPEILACQQIVQKANPELINQVHQMVDKAEFKRRQAAPIIRVQRRAFGFGRQLPIAATYPTNHRS